MIRPFAYRRLRRHAASSSISARVNSEKSPTRVNWSERMAVTLCLLIESIATVSTPRQQGCRTVGGSVWWITSGACARSYPCPRQRSYDGVNDGTTSNNSAKVTTMLIHESLYQPERQFARENEPEA